MRVTRTSAFAVVLAWASLVAAQDDLTAPRGPSVSMAPPGLTSITRGKPGEVSLRFRVARGYHVNSNTPRSEFLIPTVLKLNAPTDIVIGKITYPGGHDMSFPFAPNEKLSVYTGDFGVDVVVRPLRTVVPGKYMIHGELRYQACDHAACYPPKKLPMKFEIKVLKGQVTSGRRNPGQSPHVHK
jgi:hypothetical protein